MGFESNPSIKSFEAPLGGGLDEVRSVVDLPLSSFVTLDNFRTSEGGNRIEKRNGTADIAAIHTAIGAHDVFGFTTYYDSTPAFCQLVVTEDKVWRKVGAAAWASIHTWDSTLAHPVKVLEVQGKQIIVTEIENIMILADGTKVQLGITAPNPNTLPTLTEVDVTETAAIPLDEDFDYVSTAAMTTAGWVDGDSSGESVLVSGSDPNSTAGPDADQKYLRLYDDSPGTTNYAQRSKTVSNIGSVYNLEFDVYFDALCYVPWNGEMLVNVYNGSAVLQLRFAGPWSDFYNGVAWEGFYKARTKQDAWVNWKFSVDTTNPSASKFVAYKDGVEVGSGTFDNASATASQVVIKVKTGSTALAAIPPNETCYPDVWFDHIKIGGSGVQSGGGNLNGTYRYAVTYARSSENYPGESNPIKSIVNAVSFTGTGLNDLTSGGTYTGADDRVIRVRIDAAAATDTMEWSEDEGETWNATDLPIVSKMYLPWGVELNWNATTGHTATEYWDITCEAFSATPINQRVTFTSIPTSSDPQVDQRRIYRTMPGGASYYLLAIINDNTTTTFSDNIPDHALGDAMKEDADIAPLGKYSAWWDDRLWIATDENIVYYSRLAVPDAFNESGSGARYVSVRRGEQDDEITGIAEYSSHLFIFKRESISMIRKKLSAAYGIYEVSKGYGNIAPWSLIEVYGLLLFVSYRGWEAFNGQSAYSAKFSLPLRDTLKTMDKTKLDYITTVQLAGRNEVMLSIPDRTSGSAVTVVCNYTTGKFYTFSFVKTPSCFAVARDSSKEIQVYMGTRDGYVGTFDSGSQDFGVSYTATARTPWADLKKYQHFRRAEFEYECLTDMTITVNYYLNLDKDSMKVVTLTGNTPAATDRDIRRPIANYDELGLRGKFFAMKFTNAEAIGEDLKIARYEIFHAPMGKKRKIQAD